jgi:hypothetical protein
MCDVAALLGPDRGKGRHQKNNCNDPVKTTVSVWKMIFYKMENQYVFLFGLRKPGAKSTIFFSSGNIGEFFSEI